MKTEPAVLFSPFRLDPGNARLWRGSQVLKLRPKSFAVLRYLLEHPGQLVTKEELLNAVWPNTYVSDALVKDSILEIRKALGDDPRAPQFVETVHRRGYRFIAPITTTPPFVQGSTLQVPSSDNQHLTLSPQHSVLVGRETELARLHGWLNKALAGERQLIFVSGEPGIGKTTVVEAFLEPIEGEPWIGRGQCIEHYGAGEAYMPVLEALGRLCREPGGTRLMELLNQHAPTWLAQMPALLKTNELEALQRRAQGATHERMLREMAEAVETVTAERPLILCLEDLHWSDVSTLELLAVLARRQETARLLVLGTYRPVEMLGTGHPLRAVKQELQLHRQCEELRLGFLTEQHVAEYLMSRFAVGAHGHASLQQLARAIHQRTEGNPLFMVNVVEYMSMQGVLSASGETRPAVQIEIPASIHQMIEKQLDRLTPTEQRLLEVASIVGADFSAAAVAAGTQMITGDVEACCTGLVRREQFLRTNGVSEWPDGTVATHYHFLHALYQEVLYERVPAGQRISLHNWIGEREEQAYGEQARAIATELAVHFERGREYRKAIRYLQQAGENALRRSAHQEAVSLLTRGLELLTTLPDSREHTEQELTLQLLLGVPLMVTRGWSAPEVERVYIRARELCEQLGETRQLFSVLRGLWECYELQGKLGAARELGEQLLGLAQNIADPALLVVAHNVLADNLLWEGQFVAARAHAEQGAALYDRQQHHALASLYGGYDPGVGDLSMMALALWQLGYPDQGLKRIHEALILAQELSHPYSLAGALSFAAQFHQFRQEGQAARERAKAALVLSSEQGFPFWGALATILQGWALAVHGQGEEGIAQIRQGGAVFRAAGAEWGGSWWPALLAEVYGKAEQFEEGLAMLAEALATVDKIGEHFWEAELYRLKGQLTLQQFQVSSSKFQVTNPQSLTPNPQVEAEACFHQAIEVAQHQQAKSLELRATVSLARLWQWQGKKKPARRMLAKIYDWFTEGFDTADLQEAKALLDELT
jgi:DNA-binding winged helix-turn-helix (wHTH) protein/predicted ATPase